MILMFTAWKVHEFYVVYFVKFSNKYDKSGSWKLELKWLWHK